MSPIRKLTCEIQNQIVGNSGFTEEERGKMTSLLERALLIAIVIFILKKKVPIHGGHTWPRFANGILAGGLIILLSPKNLRDRLN